MQLMVLGRLLFIVQHMKGWCKFVESSWHMEQIQHVFRLRDTLQCSWLLRVFRRYYKVGR